MQNTDIQTIDYIDHDQGWARLLEQLGSFTDSSPDQFWIMNVESCYSAGNDLRQTPLPDNINGLPVRRTRRGGAMTYYAPGQLHLAMVVGLQRRNLEIQNFNALVMESASDVLLKNFNYTAQINLDDVGIYDANDAKIGSLGFVMKQGVVVGGLTLNMHTNLAGFDHIEVCGQHRIVANILPAPQTWPQIAWIGEQIAEQIAQRLNGASPWPVPVE